MPGLLKWRFAWCMSHFFVFFSLTSGLTDHDVAVFTLSPVIKALHLDIIGGFRLEMSNHMPVLYTWEWKVRGRGGGEKKGRQRWEITSSMSRCWLRLLQILCKLTTGTSLLLFMSHTLAEVMFFHAVSLIHPLPSLSSLQLHPTSPSLLLRQSHEGPDSCFTLDELHIWQLHVCPGLPPALTHAHAHTHRCYTTTTTTTTHNHTTTCSENHRWDDNLQHGNATFPANEAEISCRSRCVFFNMKYNKSPHMCYLCPKVDFNCCVRGNNKRKLLQELNLLCVATLNQYRSSLKRR